MAICWIFCSRLIASTSRVARWSGGRLVSRGQATPVPGRRKAWRPEPAAPVPARGLRAARPPGRQPHRGDADEQHHAADDDGDGSHTAVLDGRSTFLSGHPPLPLVEVQRARLEPVPLAHVLDPVPRFGARAAGVLDVRAVAGPARPDDVPPAVLLALGEPTTGAALTGDVPHDALGAAVGVVARLPVDHLEGVAVDREVVDEVRGAEVAVELGRPL